MSTFNKSGSLNQIRIFVLCQLSSYLYTKNSKMTMKSLAGLAKVNPSVLSGIKNGSIRSINLNKLLVIMDNLDIDYSLMVQRSGGMMYYHFGLDRHQIWTGGTDDRADYVSKMKQIVNKRPHRQHVKPKRNNVLDFKSYSQMAV